MKMQGGSHLFFLRTARGLWSIMPSLEEGFLRPVSELTGANVFARVRLSALLRVT